MEIDIANNKKSEIKTIFVDLDETIAYYEEGYGERGYIGYPLKPLVDYVKYWIDQGHNVVIFTARVAPRPKEELDRNIKNIQDWCLRNLGKVLRITAIKERGIDYIIDDKAISIISNTGRQGISMRLQEI